jgi:small subunit ribosomal protein S1
MSEKHEGDASTVTPETEEAAHDAAPEPDTAPAEATEAPEAPAEASSEPAPEAVEAAPEPGTAPAESAQPETGAEIEPPTEAPAEEAEAAAEAPAEEPPAEAPVAETDLEEAALDAQAEAQTSDEAPAPEEELAAGDAEAEIEEPADAPAEALETAREAVTAAGEGPETAAVPTSEEAAPAAAPEEEPMPTDEVSLRLLDALEKGTPIQGKVFGWNQGGYHVLIDGLLAFCPRSGIDAGPPKSPKKYIEKTYRFHVIEHRRQGNRFVLSRTKLVEEEQAKAAARMKEKLAVGAELEGKVSNLTNFGAFVDLGGGVEGMIHVSELAHTNVNHPKDVLKKGQHVKVKVLKIEDDGKRISLSAKALQPDPWRDFASSHPRGAEFTGKITGKTEFGVFVQVAEGIEGLVHVSALPPGTSLEEDQSLQEGKELSGWVKEVDLKRRRISLSLRPVPTSDPWKGVEQRYPEGDAVTGTVEEIAPFGVFINLEPGLTGLLPNSETNLPRGTNLARVYTPGSEVKVQVAKIEAKRKRLTLVPEGSKVEGSRSDFKEFKKQTQEKLGSGMPTLAAAFAKLKGEDEEG